MSNNSPDYVDNLVFPPQQIKSQDELTGAGCRQSDVLIQAIEKCEKLEKENKQLTQFLEEFNALEVAKENEQLKELLAECREWIEFLDVKMKSEKSHKNAMYFEVMLIKIDNAIGEKK